jgi:hypothetical protein
MVSPSLNLQTTLDTCSRFSSWKSAFSLSAMAGEVGSLLLLLLPLLLLVTTFVATVLLPSPS